MTRMFGHGLLFAGAVFRALAILTSGGGVTGERERGAARGLRRYRITGAVVAIALSAASAPAQEVAAVVEESPFLWGGQVYADPEARITPEIRVYFGDLPFRYPDAASCIEGAPADLMEAELRWFDFADKRGAEVCLFRLFSALGRQERATAWMEARGWRETFRHRPGIEHLYGVPEGELTRVKHVHRSEHVHLIMALLSGTAATLAALEDVLEANLEDHLAGLGERLGAAVRADPEREAKGRYRYVE